MVEHTPPAGPDDGSRWPITRAGWETLIGYRLSQETSVRLWGHPPPDIARRCGWQPTRIAAALGQAMAAWGGVCAPRLAVPPTQWVVLGDPQAPLQTLFMHLDHQGLLTEDGWLRPDRGLVCVGDYVDFRSDDPVTAGYDGVQFLSWLAAHDADQVIVLLGNHDVERVMSLRGCSLAAYREARAASDTMRHHTTAAGRRAALDAWAAEHPHHPPILAAHGYHAYVPAQGDLIRSLLLSGRLRWAATGVDDQGCTVLITHAGVTWREHDLLGQPADAVAWATVLNGCLRRAVDHVREDWMAHRQVPLDLAPLYTPWTSTRPNGGALIHRPVGRREPSPSDTLLGLDPPLAPRAAPPETFLLPGLHQVVGHTIAAQRLVRWLHPQVSEGAHSAGQGPMLVLTPGPHQPHLDLPVEAIGASASMWFTDVGLAQAAPGDVEMLRLASCV